MKSPARLGLMVAIARAAAMALAVMLLAISCNQIQSQSKPSSPQSQVESAPSIQSEEKKEDENLPLATGGDLVLNQDSARPAPPATAA